MVERQELHCHNCGRYVQFDVDMSLNGNHVFNCPVCGHEHCRVVKDGIITGERWDQRNGNTTYISSNTLTYSANSTYSLYVAATGSIVINPATQPSSYNNLQTNGSYFLYSSWMNTTAGTGATAGTVVARIVV